MLRLASILSVIAWLLLGVGGTGAVPAAVAAGTGNAEVSSAVSFGSTPNLRDMKPRYNSTGPSDKPLRLIPPNGSNGGKPDTALQTSVTSAAVSPTSVGSFAGVGNGDYGFAPDAAPPDTNGAVGATQYVQWVNESFAVFSKPTSTAAAKLLYGPVAGSTLFQSLGGGCAANNDGDPIAQYDKANGRWILTQFSVTNPSTYGYLQCVAVSQTSDATGKWNVYAFSEPYFNDYPKLGVWPDGYYLTFNMFNGNSFVGARVCALNAANMRSGVAATQQCFQLSSSYGSLLPADVDGATTPPAGSPEYLLNFGTNSLNTWLFHVNWTTPASSTLTGPTNIAVSPFSVACNGGSCIPQSGTKQKLDSLADRLMYRLAYRNFGTSASLVVNHSVVGSGGVGSAIRWYELHIASPSGSPAVYHTPTVAQQGTYSPDSTYRWMGSIAMDKVGDIAVGYSASSSTTHPGIRLAVRTSADAAGTLEAEQTILTGGGSQTRNLNRWGDYSAMTVDPVDDCTFYYTNEYLKTSGTFNWSTWIYAFKLPGC